MIKLFVADDHQMVRQGLRKFIEGRVEMEIAGEAADGKELLGRLEEVEADVLLLDISMPGPGFLEIMAHLKRHYPRLPVLVVSMHPEKQWAIQALKAGAAGYVTKTHSFQELAEGIQRVFGGGRYITSEVADSLARRLGAGEDGMPHDGLSPKEFQVLRKLGCGKMAKTVAREMGLSPKTVSTYRTRILRKLNLETNADLVRYAMEHDLTD